MALHAYRDVVGNGLEPCCSPPFSGQREKKEMDGGRRGGLESVESGHRGRGSGGRVLTRCSAKKVQKRGGQCLCL